MKDFLHSFAFNTRGIGRLQYFWRFLFGTLPLLVLADATLDGKDPGDTLFIALFFLALLIGWSFLSIVKRLADMNRPWTHTFLALMPVYNLLLACQLQLTPGTHQMLKRYGNDPYEY